MDPNYKGEVVKHDVAKYVPETEYVVKVLAHSEEGTHDGRGLSMFIYDKHEHKATRINESCVRPLDT